MTKVGGLTVANTGYRLPTTKNQQLVSDHRPLNWSTDIQVTTGEHSGSKIQDPKSKIVEVRVPATSANLGAGFDVLGLALTLYNVFTVRPGESTTIEVVGYDGEMALDESNLFHRAFAHLYLLGGTQPPPVKIHMQLDVPHGRGLGSSATAVVGGLLAANTLLGEPY